MISLLDVYETIVLLVLCLKISAKLQQIAIKAQPVILNFKLSFKPRWGHKSKKSKRKDNPLESKNVPNWRQKLNIGDYWNISLGCTCVHPENEREEKWVWHVAFSNIFLPFLYEISFSSIHWSQPQRYMHWLWDVGLQNPLIPMSFVT